MRSCQPRTNMLEVKRNVYQIQRNSINILADIFLTELLFSIVDSTSDCHPRGPGFDSRLYSRKFSGSRPIGSGTRSTQPREDNWVATWMRSSEIRLRKLKLRLRDKPFANYKAPSTALWQQLLQSILALQGCSVTDLRIFLAYCHVLWHCVLIMYKIVIVKRNCPLRISGIGRTPPPPRAKL